jgi:hypothetical protein
MLLFVINFAVELWPPNIGIIFLFSPLIRIAYYADKTAGFICDLAFILRSSICVDCGEIGRSSSVNEVFAFPFKSNLNQAAVRTRGPNVNAEELQVC